MSGSTYESYTCKVYDGKGVEEGKVFFEPNKQIDPEGMSNWVAFLFDFWAICSQTGAENKFYLIGSMNPAEVWDRWTENLKGSHLSLALCGGAANLFIVKNKKTCFDPTKNQACF